MGTQTGTPTDTYSLSQDSEPQMPSCFFVSGGKTPFQAASIRKMLSSVLFFRNSGGERAWVRLRKYSSSWAGTRLLSEQRLWRKELGWVCCWEELVSGEGRAEGHERGERRPGPKSLAPAGQLWGFMTVMILLSLNSFSLIITMPVTPIWPTPPCDFETVINTIRESTVEI